MYKTALVSTNFDEEFAQMMKDIYVKTENNAIFSLTKAKRGETKTTYDIISGYKAEHYYMVDKIFHNVPGEFITANCHVICFDMAVDVHHYNMIQELARLAHEGEDPHNPSEIVVVAPSYGTGYADDGSETDSSLPYPLHALLVGGCIPAQRVYGLLYARRFDTHHGIGLQSDGQHHGRHGEV